jgi:hypothetical protein
MAMLNWELYHWPSSLGRLRLSVSFVKQGSIGHPEHECYAQAKPATDLWPPCVSFYPHKAMGAVQYSCHHEPGKQAQSAVACFPALSAAAARMHLPSGAVFTRRMRMSDQSFPDAETHFCNAFAQPDPPEELLKLLNEHPTYPAVVDLMTYYTSAAEEDPWRALTLASALATVRDAPNAPQIGNLTLLELFNRELAAHHPRGLDVDNEKAQEFGPTNTFLIHSLLSGLSFKHNLTSSEDQNANIMKGLDARADSPASEILVTGTCIQLLTGGSRIVSLLNSYIQSPEEVAVKLRRQQAAGIVKNANAAKLLEVGRPFVQFEILTQPFHSLLSSTPKPGSRHKMTLMMRGTFCFRQMHKGYVPFTFN